MLWMITKFIMCLLAAGALGFIAGWILSSLIKNDKLEAKFGQIKDDSETMRAELNQSYKDLESKDDEIEAIQLQMQALQKELMTRNMDLEECQKFDHTSTEGNTLLLENNTLKEEISEYKYLENENTLLHNEIKELSIEKEKFLKELDTHRSTINGKDKTQKSGKCKAKIKKLKTRIIALETLLEKSKKRYRKIEKFLDSTDQKETFLSQQKKRKKTKTKKQASEFDFQKTLSDPEIKKLLGDPDK